MKKLLIALFVFTIISCEKSDPIKDKVILEVKNKMKNPDSFEFVSYEVFKEINFKEAKISLPMVKELIEITSGEEKAKYQKEYDFINNNTDNDKTAIYIVYLTAKGTNSFGAVIQSKYSVKVLNNENIDIIYVNEKK
jgi:hypothetical protein